MTEFDLVVIGGGPGGYSLAVRQAKKGWKVALVECHEIGGTCLNRGCIPTKALLASAKGFHFLKNVWRLGLSVGNPGFSWEKVQIRKNKVINQLQIGIQKQLTDAGVEVIKGMAALFSKKRVVVSGASRYEITGKKICLATGSIPGMPASFPKEPSMLWTSDEALKIAEIPKTLLVIGGGVIGLELGQIFLEFGAKVTIVEMMPQILTGLDAATARRLVPVFRKAGLEILTGTKVEDLHIDKSQVSARIAGETRNFEKVLLAIGRKPNFSCFQGSDLKIQFDGGTVAVNDRFETSEPEIFAIGDAIKGPMLAHKATYDAYVLAQQWNGHKVIPDYSAVPSCVYTFPEIAWVGLSEEEAARRGLQYRVGKFLFSANGRAQAIDEPDGAAKTLIGNDGKLLGTVIWGTEASNLIMEPTILQTFDILENRFDNLIHPHPTLSEIYMETFRNALERNIVSTQ